MSTHPIAMNRLPIHQRNNIIFSKRPFAICNIVILLCMTTTTTSCGFTLTDTNIAKLLCYSCDLWVLSQRVKSPWRQTLLNNIDGLWDWERDGLKGGFLGFHCFFEKMLFTQTKDIFCKYETVVVFLWRRFLNVLDFI